MLRLKEMDGVVLMKGIEILYGFFINIVNFCVIS